MGKQARRKREQRQGSEWQAIIRQARQKWLGKKVQFDLGRGDGIQLAKVTSISNGGDVVVECLPGYGARVPGLMMSLGYVENTLSLVNE